LTKSPRGRPPDRKFPQRILAAAAELFAEKEFHRVSTEEIAERAGAGKGTVYRHFPSKETLYVAATIHGLARLRGDLKAALDAAAPAGVRVEVIVRRLVSYFWDKREFFFLLRNFAALPSDYRRRYEAERRGLSTLIRDALAAGIDEGVLRSDLDAAVAAEALLGMVRAVNRVKSDMVTLENVSDATVALFLNGCTGDQDCEPGG
jgi:AcrR family transcriptional regulator